MTLTTSVNFETDEVFEMVNDLLKLFSNAGQIAILKEVERRIERIIVLKYPRQTNAPLERKYSWGDGKLHKFKSLKAQRGFFAKVRNGSIFIPYRRTGKLARSLSFTVDQNALLLRVAIPENSDAGKYAPFVVGTKLQQSSYFAKRTYWKPLTFIIEEQTGQIEEAFKVALETIAREINGIT